MLTSLAIAAATAGCNALTVHEAVLSTQQRVAMVSSPGDGVSPPVTAVLLEGSKGEFVPVSTGFGPAPVTAVLTGAGAGIAIGAGTYGAARVAKPPVTTVTQNQNGGSAQATGGTGGSGGTSFGSSSTSFGGSSSAQGGSSSNFSSNTASGGSNFNSNTASGGQGGSASNSNSNSNTAQGGSGGDATSRSTSF